GPVAASLPWADGGLSAPTPWRVMRLALLLAADPAGAAKPIEGLVEPTERERARRVGERLAAAEALAASARRPSEIARALDPLDPAELLWLALGSDRAAGQVEGFLARGRALRLAITGRDLVEAGVEEGPAIGLALDETRRARLDGVIDAEGELDFALGRARAGGQP
ncbi:MAG TPA: hypothetical protein VLA66_06150, partial [Thermoanaerobaculia bacterium]|nr:hypothetical protein [Thermoanaerobaculia bacterium]